MITCYRFSKNGFKSQFQEHLADAISYFKDIKKTIKDLNLNKHQQELVDLAIADKNIDPDFKIHGVFVFLKKPSKQDFDHYLNHLSVDRQPSFNNDLHKKSFPKKTVCYIDDGFCFCTENKTTLEEAYKNKYDAVFIPL